MSTMKRKFRITDDGPFEALRILASIGIALIVTFVVLAFVSKQPLTDFIRLLTYPLSKPSYFGYVSKRIKSARGCLDTNANTINVTTNAIPMEARIRNASKGPSSVIRNFLFIVLICLPP